MNLLNIPFSKLGPDDIFRPWLPATVINPHTNKKIKVYGLIDTGADECALPAPYAVLLGHNLQSGYPKEINTGNGKTLAYSHTVRIEIPDFTVQDTLIDFMPNLNVPLLGVKSFLSNFILAIDYPGLNFSLRIKNSP
ncbi:MAG: retropepsin-like aspartic protease [bacterium]